MEEVKLEHLMVESLRSIVDANEREKVQSPPNLSDSPKTDVLKEARSLKVIFIPITI